MADRFGNEFFDDAVRRTGADEAGDYGGAKSLDDDECCFHIDRSFVKVIDG